MPTLSPQAQRLACAAPALAFFAAFWLLPVLQLVALPAQKGWATYFAVLTEARYLKSLLQTLGLSLVVTAATLVLGAGVGVTLARQRFAGRGLLLSLLTLPLSFPGVIIGFFMILLGGRQGLVADLTEALGAGRLTRPWKRRPDRSVPAPGAWCATCGGPSWPPPPWPAVRWCSPPPWAPSAPPSRWPASTRCCPSRSTTNSPTTPTSHSPPAFR